MISSIPVLLPLMLGGVALVFRLDEHTGWGSKVGASLLAIAFGALLSNTGLVPTASPLYDVVYGPVTSLAIVWLLFAVDLRLLADAGPRMLGTFVLAVVATALGAVVAFAALRGAFPDPQGLPDLAARLAGTFTGTYSGGGLNFAAVGREVELPASLYSAAAAADNVVTTLWMAATLALPVWLARFYPSPPAAPPRDAPRPHLLAEQPLRIADVAALGTLGLVLTAAADGLAARVPLPSVLWLTTLALLVAQVPWVRRLRGAMPLGLFALHLFFVQLGIASRVSEILAQGLEVFWFAVIVVAVHGLVTFGAGRLLRLDVETLAVASQAAVGGPSTAMAVAVARDREDLVVPGVVVGLLGYALGTYAGLAVAALLSG
jgi:uncharacterized membrane protein